MSSNWTLHCVVIYLSLQDVQLTAANDDNYFVFEDIIYQVMLAFSRDTEVAETFSCGSANPAKVREVGVSGSSFASDITRARLDIL